MKYHFEIEQGTEEWQALRAGRVGGSSCSVFLNGSDIEDNRGCCPNCESISISWRKTKKDYRCTYCKQEFTHAIPYCDTEKAKSLGEGAQTLVYRKVHELVCGKEDGYLGEEMERGSNLEPVARERYGNEKFITIDQIGYISKGPYLGVSPDGLIDDDGGLEIKCPVGTEFVRFADKREIPKDHYSQMQWALWITGREWWDYAVFHPNYEPFDLIVERVYPDESIHRQFSLKVPVYIKEIERVLNKVAVQKQDA